PARADRAAWALSAVPGQAVRFLAGLLEPAPALTAKQLGRLIAQLDAREPLRSKAVAALARQGRRAQPALRPAPRRNLSPVAARLINALLVRLGRIAPGSESLRALRAVEVLERLGSPAAQRALSALARGAPGAALKAEAEASLGRLRHRPGGD